MTRVFTCQWQDVVASHLSSSPRTDHNYVCSSINEAKKNCVRIRKYCWDSVSAVAHIYQWVAEDASFSAQPADRVVCLQLHAAVARIRYSR